MSASLALAGVMCLIAAIPLLLSLPHDVILHNVVSPLFSDLAAFPKSALPTSAGYLAAGPATSARLYYMFYEATSPAEPLEDTPLILWLQGGPGCSGLIGNFYELGPWRISERLALVSNPGAWNSKYGVLFIDNPVGTGFSTADEDEDIPVDQPGVVAHLYHGLLQFYDKFPAFRNRPFYVAGESYAGKYVPALGDFLVSKLDEAKQPLMAPLLPSASVPGTFLHPFRLDGLIMGNALVHPRTQVQTHADTSYYAGIIDRKQKEEVAAWASRVVGHIDRGEWGDAYRQRTDLVNWIQNISGLATLLDVRRERAYHFNRNKTEWLALLLNRPQVKAALGADPSKTWVSCCPRVRRRMANDTMKSTKHQVESLLARLPVLMYQGMFDLKDGAACSEEWMREMVWPHTGAFFGTAREVWAVANETAGYWRAYGSLTHVVLLGAGHEVPADQTLHSQAMIETWIQLQRSHTAELEQFLKRRLQPDEASHQGEDIPALDERLQVEDIKEDGGTPSVAVDEGGGMERGHLEEMATQQQDASTMPQEEGGESPEAQE